MVLQMCDWFKFISYICIVINGSKKITCVYKDEYNDLQTRVKLVKKSTEFRRPSRVAVFFLPFIN